MSVTLPTMPAISGPIRYENVLDLVVTRYLYAMSYYRKFFAKTRLWYDFYRGIYAGNFPAYRHNIHVPALFAQINSNTALTVQGIFSQDPYIDFISGPPELRAVARKWAALVSQEFDDAKLLQTAVDFFNGAHIYGTAFAEYGWKTDIGKTTTRVFDAFGREQQIPIDVTYFDGPILQNKDILDVLPEPGAKRVEAANWVIKRSYDDVDNILAEAAIGGDLFRYDPNALKQLLTTPMAGGDDDVYKQRWGVYSLPSVWQAKRTERYAKPVEIIEMIGTVPSEFAINGNRHVVITIANKRVILRYDENPWGRRNGLIQACPMPDPHHLHGIGKVEVGYKLQAVMNKLMNAKLDALEFAIEPQWVVADDLNVTGDSWHSRPGKLHKVNATRSIQDSVMPILPNLSAFGTVFNELEYVSQALQKGGGIIEDTVQGLDATSHTTAAEFMSRKQGAMNRLHLEQLLAEAMFMEPTAQAFYEMSDRWMPLPKQIQRLGSAAIMDDLSGMPITPTMTLGPDDIGHRFIARARGASKAMGKAQMNAALSQALPLVTQHPVGLQITNWMAFFTDYYRSMDLDPKDLIIATGMVPQLNQMAMMSQAGNPEGALLAGGQQMGGMAPPMGGMNGQ